MIRILSAVAMLALASNALAQGYPTKPVRFLVAFAPGGPVDLAARLVGQKLPDVLGQQVVVDNRAGAGGNIGAAAVAKSAARRLHGAPDELGDRGEHDAVLEPGLRRRARLRAGDPDRHPAQHDLRERRRTGEEPGRAAHGCAKGSRLVYASPGAGTTPHLTAEMLFKVLAKVDTTPVQYKGAGPMVAAVVGGEPPVGSGAISGPLAQVRAGKLRALAVSSSRRLPTLPDVPTLGELGFQGMEDYTWIAMFVPAGTPPEIVQRLNDAVNRALQAPDVRERLEALAFEPVGGTQAQFAEYVKAEIAKWAKVVRETGAKSD